MNPSEPIRDPVPTAWLSEPRWYLWDGGFLLLSQSEGIVPAHAHHAIQIVVALDGEPAISAMLFVDPESFEGVWLRTSLTQPITVVPDERLAACTPGFRTFHERHLQSIEVVPLIRHCVHALCAGSPPVRQPDPRITKSLKRINESKQLRVTLEEIAASVFLSPSRFAHLFSQQLGLPFRHYLLWRKLARSILAIGRGESMTDAAQAADFADAPHLSRTFNRMFGIKPSALMRGEFFEIQSPFQTHG